MKKHVRYCATAATAVMFAAVMSIAVARAQNANLNVNVDLLAIGNAIAGAVNNNQNREACIANLANSTDYAAGYKYNVLVANLAQHPYLHSNSIVFYGSAICGDAHVAVWAFGSGEFTREGDGGYLNWYLIGNFTRQGDQGRNVIFSQRA